MTVVRREVKSRNKTVFHKLAKGLVKAGLRPNHISLLSFAFAIVAHLGLYYMSSSLWGGVILALLGIQLRLLCNLIDGLMAIEGNLSSPQGELYNDVPDRFSDWVIILGVGHVLVSLTYGWELVWCAVTFAILTAYVRVLGASQGVGQFFIGPMAKQHRMAVLNVGIIATVIEQLAFNSWGWSLYVSIIIILLGSIITVFRRLKVISDSLGR